VHVQALTSRPLFAEVYARRPIPRLQSSAEAVERRVVQIDLILQLSDVAAGRQLIEPYPAEPDWSIAS
jgi:hypothetical protein